MVINLPLRATWTLSISADLFETLGIKNELYFLLVGFVEMTRSMNESRF